MRERGGEVAADSKAREKGERESEIFLCFSFLVLCVCLSLFSVFLISSACPPLPSPHLFIILKKERRTKRIRMKRKTCC